jgi:hypothetical protein
MTVQPTEQCVQTDLIVSIARVAADCAVACVTEPPVAAIAAKPPIARPDPRKKPRRSMPFDPLFTMIGERPDRRVYPLVFFLSIFFLPYPVLPDELF